MDKLPETINIGYQTIKLIEEDSHMMEALGLYKQQEHIIAFRKNQNDREKSNTIIHEILHAIWFTQGLRNEDGAEERIVNTFANGICQVMRDNRRLMRILAQGVSDEG